MTNQPEVPPVDIKKGLGTWLGVALTVIVGLGAVLTDVVNENPDLPPSLLAKLSAGIAAITIFGRMLQSAALLFGSNKPSTVVNVPPTEQVTMIEEEPKEEDYLYDINGSQIDDDLHEGAPVDAAIPQASPRHNGPGTDLHDAQGA